MKNLKGALICFENSNIKPNYSALAREYNVDRRTAKKMYLGLYNNKSKERIKPSKLDKYQEIIKTKLEIPGVTRKAVYEYIKSNLDNCIGTDNVNIFL